MLVSLDVPPESLELEITETVLLADPSRVYQVLSALRTFGIRIAIDDYGTGYSSLAYLHDLPVDDLKLDRSFLMRSGGDPRSTIWLSPNQLRSSAFGSTTATAPPS